MATEKPSLMSFSTTSGTVATRFSNGKVSRGMPMRWAPRWASALGWLEEVDMQSLLEFKNGFPPDRPIPCHSCPWEELVLHGHWHGLNDLETVSGRLP
jgi:hypothetical protein